MTKNLQISFIVPLIAYAYVAFYGWKGPPHRPSRSWRERSSKPDMSLNVLI